jgi:general secretion pathway protein A
MSPSKNPVTLFGLKYNPFLPDIPVENLWRHPAVDPFFFRVENTVMDGGFALLTGEPGLGKSKILHLLHQHLSRLGHGVVVVAMERPQNSLADLYREMGSLFGTALNVSNRYGGFKALRERWRGHINSTLLHPVLLIDEAQEASPIVFKELRLLASADFDSKCLLTCVLCGDGRLPEVLAQRDLVPLGSRVRARLTLEALTDRDSTAFLEHSLEAAGGSHLLTDGLKQTLVEHSLGNPRILCIMANDLLYAAAARDLQKLDEKLDLDLFAGHSTKPPRSRPASAAGRRVA